MMRQSHFGDLMQEREGGREGGVGLEKDAQRPRETREVVRGQGGDQQQEAGFQDGEQGEGGREGGGVRLEVGEGPGEGHELGGLEGGPAVVL
jgi:hypothetical protein